MNRTIPLAAKVGSVFAGSLTAILVSDLALRIKFSEGSRLLILPVLGSYVAHGIILGLVISLVRSRSWRDILAKQSAVLALGLGVIFLGSFGLAFFISPADPEVIEGITIVAIPIFAATFLCAVMDLAWGRLMSLLPLMLLVWGAAGALLEDVGFGPFDIIGHWLLLVAMYGAFIFGMFGSIPKFSPPNDSK